MPGPPPSPSLLPSLVTVCGSCAPVSAAAVLHSSLRWLRRAHGRHCTVATATQTLQRGPAPSLKRWPEGAAVTARNGGGEAAGSAGARGTARCRHWMGACCTCHAVNLRCAGKLRGCQPSPWALASALLPVTVRAGRSSASGQSCLALPRTRRQAAHSGPVCWEGSPPE